jgi:hypothetical protein
VSAPAQELAANLRSLSTAAKVNVAAMVIAIVAIVIQIAAGVDYPAIPPGPIILAVTVVLVVFTSMRWVAVVAVVVPLFLAVGGTVASIADDDSALRHPEDVVAFAATVVQMAALVVAVVTGGRALRQQRA